MSTSFKLLGIHFGVDQNNITQNLEECYKCFKTILNIWSQRDLSITGKITIIKSLALSQLQYTTSVLYVPEDYIKNKETKIFKISFGKINHLKSKQRH